MVSDRTRSPQVIVDVSFGSFDSQGITPENQRKNRSNPSNNTNFYSTFRDYKSHKCPLTNWYMRYNEPLLCLLIWDWLMTDRDPRRTAKAFSPRVLSHQKKSSFFLIENRLLLFIKINCVNEKLGRASGGPKLVPSRDYSCLVFLTLPKWRFITPYAVVSDG